MRALALEMGVISWDVHTHLFPFSFCLSFPHNTDRRLHTHSVECHISYSCLLLFTVPYVYSLA